MSFVYRHGDELRLSCHFLKAGFAKSIPGAKWDKKAKIWKYPLGRTSARAVWKNFKRAEGWQEIIDFLKLPNVEYLGNQKLDLLQNQEFSVRRGLKFPRFAILNDRGTGKTGVAITILNHFFNAGLVKHCLIIAPLSVVEEVWVKEIQRFSDLMAIALTGRSTKEKLKKLKEGLDAQIWISNYEFVRIAVNTLSRLPLDCIIADESSKIKNHSAKVSRAIWKLAENVRFRMILTGVLTPNHPLEAFSQYRFLEPSIFGTDWHRFRYRYAIYGGYENREVVDYQNIDDFTKKLFSVAVRVKKEDAFDLPPKIFQKRIIELNPKTRKIYDSLKEGFITEIQGQRLTAQNALIKILRLQQITSGFIRSDNRYISIATPKMDEMFQFLTDEVPEDKKVVIFCRFLRSISEIENRSKWSIVSLTGKDNHEARRNAIHEFQQGDAKLFVTQIKVGSLGINLTASSLTIFFENPWSYGDRIQCEDRLHRYGQNRSVTYVDLIVKNSIDEIILKTLKEKKDLIDVIQKHGLDFFKIV